MKEESFELFYGTGGHGGPYPSYSSAVNRAVALLKGSPTERDILIKARTIQGYELRTVVHKYDDGRIEVRD